MSEGERGAAAGAGAGEGADHATQCKTGRGRNWTFEEVYVACMAASRANREMGESTWQTRASAAARYFLALARQLEEENAWNVFKTEGSKKVAVSPEEAHAERNVIVSQNGKKIHAVLVKAQQVWSTAVTHLWGVYEKLLVVNGETQEKVLPSGKTVEEIIEALTLAWHQHKHGGNKPDATVVPGGKPNIDLACFLKLGPALLGGANDVNFMPSAEELHKAMQGHVHTREAQRGKKKQCLADENRDRVGKNLGGSGAASGMRVLQQSPGLVDSMRVLQQSPGLLDSMRITARMEALQTAMKFATDDATKAMLSRCMTDVALGHMDFAASVRPSHTSPAPSMLSTPLTAPHPHGAGGSPGSISPAGAQALSFACAPSGGAHGQATAEESADEDD